jgi:flagellar motor switch protein FliM
VTDVTAPTASARTATPSQAYDFRRPPKISRDRQSMLDTLQGRFAMSLQAFLSSRLRRPTDVTAGGRDFLTFGEFVDSLGDSCTAFTYDLGEQVGTHGAVLLDPMLAGFLVDRLFGGTGDASGDRGALTTLEQRVVNGLIDKAIGLFKDVWQEHLKMTPTSLGVELFPETLKITPREEQVILFRVSASSAATPIGTLTVCLPLGALESFLQQEAPAPPSRPRAKQAERSAARALVEEHLRQASVPVSARLPEFQVAAADIVRLRPGHVLRTGLPLQSEVDVLANGRPLFVGVLGRQQGFMGLRILRPAKVGPRRPNSTRGRIAP